MFLLRGRCGFDSRREYHSDRNYCGHFYTISGNNRKVLFIRRGWNKYIDDLRDNLEAKGVKTENFDMFNMSAYNRAVTENMPIITVEGWEDVHPLLKLIPPDWDDSIPFGVFYSPTPTKLVKKFVDLLSSIAAK